MKNFTLKAAAMLFVAVLLNITAQSQSLNDSKFGKGLRFIANDSSFTLHLGARFQTLYEGTYSQASEDWSDQFLIRRARLKLDGYAYTPKLKYKIELGLSNRDIGGSLIPENNFASNIILDAVAKWNFYKNLELWVGQTKLPGNRERVISSQKLQFVDRSEVNGRFNIDRDAGIQLHNEHETGNIIWREAVSVSMGDGRNITATNDVNENFVGSINLGGYDYTARVEVLPLGSFIKDGDYVSADIYREQSPKLALGVTYDFNDNASRQRGQLGGFMSEQRDLRSVFADAMFKYQGISVLAEYANKKAPDGPVVYTETGKFKEAFYTGSGFNVQTGYVFPSNFEVAGRYTTIHPEDVTQRADFKEYTLGVSKYIVGHSLKVQSDVTMVDRDGTNNNDIVFRMQLEVAL